MKNFNNRCYTLLYKILAGSLFLLISSSVLASNQVKPFSASYKVFRNNQQVAKADFSLSQRNGVWVWKMSSKPIGVYSWLTRKKPYTETHMRQTADGLLLSIEISGDYPDRNPDRAGWFDQNNKKAYYSDKKQHLQIDFTDPLYNYHSIHLLYQQMKQQGLTESEIHFYKKGKFYHCTLTLEPDVEIAAEGTTRKVDRLIQKYTGSKRSMLFYYEGHDLAPLKIEQERSGDTSVMWRENVR